MRNWFDELLGKGIRRAGFGVVEAAGGSAAII
jgi:hypothetical protein